MKNSEMSNENSDNSILDAFGPMDEKSVRDRAFTASLRVKLGLDSPPRGATLALRYMGQGLIDTDPRKVPHVLGYWDSETQCLDIMTENFEVHGSLESANRRAVWLVSQGATIAEIFPSVGEKVTHGEDGETEVKRSAAQDFA